MRKQIGFKAEEQACQFLQKQGLEIVARNVRFKQGEIDIVACEGNILVIVEVKSSTSEFIEPVYHIDRKKKKTLIKLAKLYCYRENLKDIQIRFDVIIVRYLCNEIEWIKNAFSETEGW